MLISISSVLYAELYYVQASYSNHTKHNKTHKHALKFNKRVYLKPTSINTRITAVCAKSDSIITSKHDLHHILVENNNAHILFIIKSGLAV